MKRVPIKCDYISAINFTKNPIHHSRIKHIEIRHHFIKDYMQKKDIFLEFVGTHNQLADIFTKSIDREQFCKIKSDFGLMNLL